MSARSPLFLITSAIPLPSILFEEKLLNLTNRLSKREWFLLYWYGFFSWGLKAYVCWNDWSDSKAGCISDWLALIPLPSDFDLLATPIVKPIPSLWRPSKKGRPPICCSMNQMTWPCFITIFLSTRVSSRHLVQRPAREIFLRFSFKSNKG